MTPRAASPHQRVPTSTSALRTVMKTPTSNLKKRRFGWEATFMVTPRPASRPRVGRWGTYYTGNYKTFRAEMADLLARVDLPPPTDNPLAVCVEFVCPSPKKPTNPYPMGDIDNYTKALFDSVQKAGFFNDDKQIVEVHATKRYVYPGEEPHITMLVSLEGFGVTFEYSEDVLDQPDTISMEELEDDSED